MKEIQYTYFRFEGVRPEVGNHPPADHMRPASEPNPAPQYNIDFYFFVKQTLQKVKY